MLDLFILIAQFVGSGVLLFAYFGMRAVIRVIALYLIFLTIGGNFVSGVTMFIMFIIKVLIVLVLMAIFIKVDYIVEVCGGLRKIEAKNK